jgi:magnesium transporter
MARKIRRHKQHKPRIKRQTQPGATPGTVHVARDSPQPVVRLMAYGPTEYVEQTIVRPAELEPYLSKYPVNWINVDGLGDAHLIQELGERFQLHPLALEDVVNVHQRAKVEPYENYLFVAARMVKLTPTFHSEQISMFVGSHYVLTFQERSGDCLDPIRDRIRKNSGRIRNSHTDYLMYAILDATIDSYFPIVDAAADRLEELEANVADQQMAQTMSGIHDVRNELLLLRRYIWPHRDALNELIRDEHPLIHNSTLIFLRDAYDHTMQLIDLLEIYREMCGDLREYYLSLTSNRMNEIMKVLTIMATIFIPLSFVASLYGMNFDTREPWNMPELHWPFGYPLVLGLMACIAGGLLFYFWRKGWLSSSDQFATNSLKELHADDH